MRIRPYEPEDREAVQAIIADNARVLGRNGDSHYGEYAEEHLAMGVNAVAELGGRVVCFCQFLPDRMGPGVALVPCFVVDVGLHESSGYVRAHLAMEAHIRNAGILRLVAHVPPGHEKFRRYLTERRGYRPYHEDNGTLYLVKELKEG